LFELPTADDTASPFSDRVLPNTRRRLSKVAPNRKASDAAMTNVFA
jgi:hypothetical protein